MTRPNKQLLHLQQHHGYLPLLHGRGRVVKPWQVACDGAVISPITPRDLQRNILGNAWLELTSQSVLVQAAAAPFSVTLEKQQENQNITLRSLLPQTEELAKSLEHFMNTHIYTAYIYRYQIEWNSKYIHTYTHTHTHTHTHSLTEKDWATEQTCMTDCNDPHPNH